MPTVLITLANLGTPRRPAGSTEPVSAPVLPDASAAARQLAGLSDLRPGAADLPALRRLQRVAERSARAIVDDQPPNVAELNALALGSTARLELTAANGKLSRRLVWDDGSLTCQLARRMIDELADLDPDRLRGCARRECELLFYDNTRSRTRRWHADDPCGWRERQRRHRTT